MQGKTKVDLKQICFSNNVIRDSYYVHTNHYKHMDSVDEGARLGGSMAREATANQKEVPQSLIDVCDILGDTSSTTEPIYRRPGTSLYNKHIATVATAVFNMDRCVLSVYLQNPKEAKKPTLILSFVD